MAARRQQSGQLNRRGSSASWVRPALKALEWRFLVTTTLVRRLSVIVFLLTLASTVATVHAAENPRKMTVVSFGLFGNEGVFRREATGAAQIVATRFGGDPVIVKYNTKTGGGATIETLATTLQAEAKKMNGESDILFLNSYLARLPRWPRRRSRTASRNPQAIPAFRDARPHGSAKQGRDHFGLLFWHLHTSARRC